MSTAGKVLVVLCVLMLGVWAVLFAAVDQLNINGNKRLDEIKSDIAKLQVDVKAVQTKAEDFLIKANEEQVAKERDMRLVLTRLSTAERQIESTNETRSRVKIQLENYKKALETAKAGLEARTAEKTKYTQDKATTVALVTRLQGENADLTAELLKLREAFVKVLKKNQEDVARELKAEKGLTRQASLVR